VLGVKTTNTVDLGTSSLKFKDFYLAGAASIGGTLGVTGATTLSAALTYGGVTLSNAVTGTGNMVLSASPTLTGTITAAAANFSGAVALNGNTTIGDADTDTITQAASYVTGTQLKSAKTATNTLSLAAYDVDGTAYTNLITLTAGNTPTLALTSTGVGTMNNIDIGGTAAGTGAFTTLTSNGATTFTAGTASTTTGTGTLVITGGLGVSGRINATNFDGIIGANTAAAGSFTTLSASGVATPLSITPTGNAVSLSVTQGADANAVRLGAGGNVSAYLEARGYLGVKMLADTSTIGNFSSAGLAVTGTLSATSSITSAPTSGDGSVVVRGFAGSSSFFQLTEAAVADRWTIGVAGSSDTLQFRSGSFSMSTGTQRMSLTASGNLGITETNPTAKLQISVASAAVNGTKGVRITNPAGTIVMLECGSGGDSFVGTESGSTFNIRTNNAINATFLTNGDVGFGETSPTQKIHFKGSSTTYALAETTGTGTSSGFRMKAGAGTDFTLFTTQGGNQFGIYNNTTSAQPLTINANGALALLGASTSATGVGITFPATQSASTDANTLDDYEEGEINGSNLGLAYETPGTSSFTYSDRRGTYTKVGRIVYFTLDIRLSGFSKGTASGGLFVVGLPFAQRNTSGFDGARCTVHLYAWTYTTSPIIATVASASTSIQITRMVSNAATADIDDPDGNSIIWVTGFYFV
jgi:hypothetical protein